MNVLTFDIEEWALAKIGGYGNDKYYAKYDAILTRLLEALDSYGTKATFFCTGMMARDFPQVVKSIQCHGHEIGCHSFRHAWMNKMAGAEAREDTHVAIDSLEQCIGNKVLSYRAPAFSIGESNKWMFDILSENGIERDASIFPANRDFGGFKNFGEKIICLIEHNGIRIKEFPVCTARVMWKETAYSGGGYFRLFPYSFIKKELLKSKYSMCYFHIGDLVPEPGKVKSKEEYESYYKEKGTIQARYIRYFKSNFGKKRSFGKMMKLMEEMDFIDLQEADRQIDWSSSRIVQI